MEKVLVSIKCMVYNHESFLRQCLDGFVMQKTTFRFEAIVHDDCSTDKSAEILREYAEKYPDIIKPIFETENQYSKGGGTVSKIMDPYLHGKYIALCEGDDYWTDPYKLQKQVDFLESHPDYVMCSHKTNNFNQNRREITENYVNIHNPLTYTLDNLIVGEWYYQPLSVVYRKDSYSLAMMDKYGNYIDAVLFYHLLKQGKGYFIPEAMAMYRVHDGGVWSKVGLDRQRDMEFSARLAICNVEGTCEAAIFLLNQFTKLISRIWMLKRRKTMFASFKIIRQHFGLAFALRLFLSKMILNKKFSFEDARL